MRKQSNICQLRFMLRASLRCILFNQQTVFYTATAK